MTPSDGCELGSNGNHVDADRESRPTQRASEDRLLRVPLARAADENVKMIATIPAGRTTHGATWAINTGQCVDLR
jgi:hypothetical protein